MVVETSPTFTAAMESAVRAFEALAALVLVLGLLWSAGLAAVSWRRTTSGRAAYKALREAFGGTLLLALEILVAADLIRTVAVAATLENVLVLGLIVVIRILLSFSLEVEIEGVAPWRRAMLSGAGSLARTTHAALAPGPDSDTAPPSAP